MNVNTNSKRKFVARRTDLGLQRLKTSRQNLNSLVKLTLLNRSSAGTSVRYKPANYIHEFMLNYQWDIPMSVKDQNLQDSINNFVEKNSLLSSTDPRASGGGDPTIYRKSSPIRRPVDSVLTCLPSIRLTRRFEKTGHLTIAAYMHNLNPNDFICTEDLIMGKCNKEKCPYQHKSKYLMSEVDRLVDLISYRPTIAGFRHDDSLTQEQNFLNCRNKLRIYAQNLINRNPGKSIEAIAQNLVRWIRSRFDDNCLINLSRQMPKLNDSSNRPSHTEKSALVCDDNHLGRLAVKLEFVPYQDFDFQFDYIIQDPEYRLKHSTIAKFYNQLDPEIRMKSRFFQSKDRSVGTELETTLHSDPKNVQLWLRLANYNLSRDGTDKAECIDRALNVLSRALEANPSNPELWETYLIMFSSRVPRPKETSNLELSTLCDRAIQYSPTFSTYRLAISLCGSFRKKLSISIDLVKHLCRQQSVCTNDFERACQSQQLVETVMFICQMLIKIGQTERAIEIGFRAFGDPNNGANIRYCNIVEEKNIYTEKVAKKIKIGFDKTKIKENTLDLIKFDFPNLVEKLLTRDLIFVRLSFLHLRLYERFPETRVRTSNYSIPKLVSSFPIVLSLPKRGFILMSPEDLNMFFRHYPDSLDGIEAWKVNQEFWYSKNTSIYVAIEILHESAQHSSDARLRYGLARLYYYDGDFENCSRELSQIAFDIICNNSTTHIGTGGSEDVRGNYKEIQSLNGSYNDSTTIEQLVDIFSRLLCLTKTGDAKYQIGKGNDAKSSRSPLLWLCFILCCKIAFMRKEKIETLYEQAIGCCLVPHGLMANKSLGLRSLIFDYVKYLTESMETQGHFSQMLETVKNLCLTLPDEDFQIHLIEQITRVVTKERTRLVIMIEFCLLLNNNLALLSWMLRFGLDIGEKELIYEILLYILFESDHQLGNLDSWCWNISLALSIDKGDHSKTHQIFRLAISHDPYNLKLWKLMRAYERGVIHTKHVDSIEKTVTAKLELQLD